MNYAIQRSKKFGRADRGIAHVSPYPYLLYFEKIYFSLTTVLCILRALLLGARNTVAAEVPNPHTSAISPPINSSNRPTSSDARQKKRGTFGL